MHDLITQHRPPYPPAAIGPINTPPFDPREPPIRDFFGNLIDPFWTHGSWLRFGDYLTDPVLGHLLLRCLADEPAVRPTLDELVLFMDRYESSPGWHDDPDDRAWLDRLFNGVPQVSDPLLFLVRLQRICTFQNL